MKKNFKILSMLKPIQKAADELKNYGEVTVGTSLTRNEVLNQISTFDAVLADDEFAYDEEFFNQADQLRIVSRVGVGYENVDLTAATKHGIMVTNTPGVMAESVAEHTIALMLASSNNLVQADREVREGNWEWEKFRGMELWNGTFGQVGLGKIGYQVAKKVSACFNMRITVHDPFAPEERVLSVGGKSGSLDSTLKDSDIVSINVPLTDETKHMISKNQLRQMKDSAILVNTSRGKVIDQEALIWALKKGEIGKAALDVLDQEPPPQNSELFELDNVILTPHQASNTHQGVENMFMESTQNLISALEGKQPKFLINTELSKGK